MHQYKLKLTLYSAEGALTNNIQYIYKDTTEQVLTEYDRYSAMKHPDQLDEDGNVVHTGMKMYKVELCQACYAKIEDVEAFKTMHNFM